MLNDQSACAYCGTLYPLFLLAPLMPDMKFSVKTHVKERILKNGPVFVFEGFCLVFCC